MHTVRDREGRPRLYCSGRTQGRECSQRSGLLAPYEQQLEAYLASFGVPDDVQQQVKSQYREAGGGASKEASHRRQVESRLSRIKELYGWGDLD